MFLTQTSCTSPLLLGLMSIWSWENSFTASEYLIEWMNAGDAWCTCVHAHLSKHTQIKHISVWEGNRVSRPAISSWFWTNSSSRWTCSNAFLINEMLTQQYISDHLIFEILGEAELPLQSRSRHYERMQCIQLAGSKQTKLQRITTMQK